MSGRRAGVLGDHDVSTFEPPTRETMADLVYRQLRGAILRGDLHDQNTLNQVTLARQFNVSRVPVREALRRLQAEHLVTATPFQQYVVSVLKPDAVLELVDIREMVEVYAVRRLAIARSDELVEEMRRQNATLHDQDSDEPWLVVDVELHQMFDGPNSAAALLTLDIRTRLHRYLRTAASTRTRRLQAWSEHERIIDAIEARDADAAEAAMREHIAHTRRVIASLVSSAGTDIEDSAQ